MTGIWGEIKYCLTVKVFSYQHVSVLIVCSRVCNYMLLYFNIVLKLQKNLIQPICRRLNSPTIPKRVTLKNVKNGKSRHRPKKHIRAKNLQPRLSYLEKLIPITFVRGTNFIFSSDNKNQLMISTLLRNKSFTSIARQLMFLNYTLIGSC
jgi:hypothetical protein